jgi:L-ascorbate metabolism protein UlaG (beta-lactamase superfamily)
LIGETVLETGFIYTSNKVSKDSSIYGVMKMNQKTILGTIAAVVIIVALAQYSRSQSTANFDNSGFVDGAINVTLLNNAGVMIDVGDQRIYIDPVDLPSSYSELPADAILITHEHGDHYQANIIDMLQKEGTINVFPRIMSTQIERHDGIGVVPEDELMVGEIKVTTFYMYTYAPDPTREASHPKESQYTSYIVDIDGFTIFHAGDSKNIDEYRELKDTVNVAMLPLGPGCQTMADGEIVTVLGVISPNYFIPIHFQEDANDQFCSRFRNTIESSTGCEIYNLDHYTTHAFEIS